MCDRMKQLPTGIDQQAHAIHVLFARMVRKSPAAPALAENNDVISYQELDRRSDAIAKTLLKRRLQPEARVGVLAGRSASMVTALLGILKAGGCYVPIDRSLPLARKRLIAGDTGMHLLLYAAECRTETDFHSCVPSALSIEDLFNGPEPTDHALPAVQPDQLAYIMYTSGSTGVPKGVMIEHRGVVRLIMSADYADTDGRKRVMLMGTIGFDATTFEIWWPLLNGGTLYLVDDAIRLHATRLRDNIEQQGISTLLLTTAMCTQLLNDEPDVFRSLQQLLVGGDTLAPKTVRAIRASAPAMRIVNVYGPTENTVFSTCCVLKREDIDPIPIGIPPRFCSVHVVDDHLRLLPDGETGELLLGGEQLARGYLNQPLLTRERFIELQGIGRVYRSADIGFRRPDGRLEFVGRKDRQVKVKGYRIEPGEIESMLKALPQVSEAAVRVVACNGEKQLAGYFVAPGLDATQIRAMLSARLPDYMIPYWLLALEAMPLGINGKVDRQELPDPFASMNEQTAGSAIAEPAPARAPEVDDVAHLIGTIWNQLFRREIGLDDDFFFIGGTSIKAMHLMGCMARHNLPVNLSDIMHYRTVRKLATFVCTMRKLSLETGTRCEERPHGPQQLDIEGWQKRLKQEYDRNNRQIRKWPVAGNFPFSPIQQVQFSFETPMSIGVVHFGMPIATGTIAHAVSRIVARHQLLRSIPFRESQRMFFREHAMDRAEPLKPSLVDLSEFCFSDDEFEKAVRAMVAGLVFGGMNLLYHFIIFRRNGREQFLVSVFHHALLDRVSNELIHREILLLCSQPEEKRPADLAQEGLLFSDYVRGLYRGPQGMTQSALIEHFRLREFRNYKNAALASNRLHGSDQSQEFRIGAGFAGHVEAECSLGAATAIYVRAVCRLFELPGLPLLFIYDGRRYSGVDYYSVLGELIDYVPIVLDANIMIDEAQKTVTRILDMVNQANVNFLNLMLDAPRDRGWAEARKLIDPGEGLGEIDFAMFNFMGNTSLGRDYLTDCNDQVKTSPNPLPIYSFLNCIVVGYDDGFIFNFRSSYKTDILGLRVAFRKAADELKF